MVEHMLSKEQEIGSNVSYSNSCVLLVDENHSKDGRIPQILAIAVGIWLVSMAIYRKEGRGGAVVSSY